MYEQFAEEYVRIGGRQAFGITGSGLSLQLIDQLEQSGIEFLSTGHESTAALMAGAWARLKGEPALAVTIKGPGFMNMLPGLLCNGYEGFPSLSLSESYPQGYGDTRCHKWLDHEKAAGEFLKHHRYLQSHKGFLTDCWHAAREGNPGPVHIDMGQGKNTSLASLAPREHRALERLAEKISQSSRPLLITGSLGLHAPWAGDLQNLSIPVFTTPAGKGVIDESSDMAAGVFTGAGKPDTPEKGLLPEADLVITLDVRPGELLNPDFGSDTLHIDTVFTETGKNFPPRTLPGTQTLSDGQLRELISLLSDKCWGQDQIGDCRTRLDKIANHCPWNPAIAMGRVQSLLPGATHVMDTGNFTVIGEHFLQAGNASSVLGTPNGRYMGAALGYALGASFARPDTPTVLWIGDGGIRSLTGELALAAEHQRRLLVLVMIDGHFGSIRGSALNNGLTQRPVTLSKRSLTRIGEALGLNTGSIGNETELADVIEYWRRDPQPSLYECVLDPDTYIEMTGRLR